MLVIFYLYGVTVIKQIYFKTPGTSWSFFEHSFSQNTFDLTEPVTFRNTKTTFYWHPFRPEMAPIFRVSRLLPAFSWQSRPRSAKKKKLISNHQKTWSFFWLNLNIFLLNTAGSKNICAKEYNSSLLELHICQESGFKKQDCDTGTA